MTMHIDHKIIEAAMRQGRLERACALRRLTVSAMDSLHRGARTLMAVFVC